MSDIPEAISNMDVVYVAELLVDSHYQLAKASAADQTDGFPVEADMIRLEDRIEDLNAKWEFLSAQPFLDSPETHGRAMFPVPMFEEVTEPSNRDVRRLMNFIEMFHMEIVLGQSARMTNGIGVHDSARGISYIGNLRGLVQDYIKARTPNDFPEVSPRSPQVGPGR
jgi:hypothetical protein